MTNGNFLYVISRESVKEVVNEEEKCIPNLFVEWYDMENDFKFIDSVKLLKKNKSEQFIQKENSPD